MIREKRFELIRGELAKKGIVEGDDLAARLQVSRATIRRDLDQLEEEGLLIRTHGGAQVVDSLVELPYHSKLVAYMQEKRAIGLCASQMVPEGSVIGCTGGTTVMSVIKYMKGKTVTVVTNAINIAMELASSESTQVIVTGGAMRTRSYELVGHIADRTLDELYMDIALLGIDGLDLVRGISTYTMQEAHTASLYVNHAERVWVVADHTKVGKIAPALIAPIMKVHRLFTDPGLSPELRSELEAIGMEVVIAEM
jgi:DeoR/GlpR family transcriptional regulator of sugar metabolism